jgi:hypothetical protein
MGDLSFQFKLIIVLCIAAVLIMVGVLIMFRRKVGALKETMIEKAKGSLVFDAIVESVTDDKDPVIMFRNKDDNATIIHKYKSSGLRKYTRGDTIQVYYSERDDFFMIADDNEIFKKMFDTARLCIILTLAVPIVLMLVIILMFVLQ